MVNRIFAPEATPRIPHDCRRPAAEAPTVSHTKQVKEAACFLLKSYGPGLGAARAANPPNPRDQSSKTQLRRHKMTREDARALHPPLKDAN